ncbi:hypothetical protein NPIL_356151 [Nephila pilipes]|uniref:Uncharacterized protein n=1 Tax=Nephila pilipes TaxID=299642 RepID=A0A8X6QVH1_NEPPI|nr:hypothetical protein NPIL_356151 [Nephila pilipes]
MSFYCCIRPTKSLIDPSIQTQSKRTVVDNDLHIVATSFNPQPRSWGLYRKEELFMWLKSDVSRKEQRKPIIQNEERCVLDRSQR